MKAPQERTVRDLYDRTRHKDLALPEESAMGRRRGGGGRTEGAEQPEVAPKIENNLTVRKRSVPSNSPRVKVESGTCNVCFAPCSSCLHRNLAIVDSNMDCGSSQTCCTRSESKNSLLVRSEKGLHTKGGENDDEFSAASSHASYSENGGNKATTRSSIAADSEVDMPTKRRRLLNHDSRSPRVECHDDNNSCVTGISAANKLLLDKKKDKLSMSASSRDLTAKDYKDSNIVGHNRLRNSSVEESTEKKRSDLHVKQPSSYDRSVPADSPSLVTKKLLRTQSSASASQGLSPQRPSQGSGNSQDNIAQQHREKVHISNNNVEHSLGGRTNNRNKVKAGSSSKDLEKITSCSRNGSQEHAEIQSDDAAKRIDNVKRGQNQDLSTDTSSGRKLNTQNVVMTDCGNSEGLIDVNVCDICGDVGREYLLATCTRCLEGAEHTYCMRVKLDKVPDDEWLCEECQLNEEQNKTRSNHGASTVNILDGKNPNPASMSNPKTLQVAVTDFDSQQTSCGTPITDHLPGNDKKPHSLPTDPEARQVKCATPTAERLDTKNKIFGSMANRKRLQVVTSDIEACPPTCGTPTAGRLDKKSQGSEVLLNRKKLRIATDLESPLSSEGQLSPPKSGKRHAENTSSSNPMMFKTESPRKHDGFYRENSFQKSNKGSFKPPDNAPVRTIQAVKSAMTLPRSYSLGSMANIKAPVRSPQGPLSKQLSFNNSNSEPKVKQLTEGVASRLKPAKHSPSDLGEKGPIRTFMKSKSFKHDGSVFKDSVSLKQKHSSHLSQDEKPRMLKPMKEKNLLERKASFNLQKPNIPSSPRPESSMKSGDRKINEDNSRPGPSILKSSKKPGTIEKKQSTSLPKSEKQCTNVYPASIGVVSAKDAYAAKSSDPPCPMETVNKDSTSDCPSFILLKNDNEMPTSDLQDLVPRPSALEDLTPNVGQCQQKILESREGNKSSKIVELVQASEDILSVSPHGLLVAHNLHAPDNKLNEPNLNHQDLFDQSCTLGNLFRALVIPEQTYIWQGTFEVSRPGNSSEIHDGIQAHLSTHASPKALEVVKQLPPTIQLVEVPRCTSWPQQFNEGKPSEDNIALFFFAKDVESYERAYGKLLEKMVVGDLSLTANISGIELLIFSSDRLPEKIQRWNGLLYFWGVFYARKANSSTELVTVTDHCPLEPTNGPFDKLVCSPKASQSLCIDLNECPDDELYDPTISPGSEIEKSGASLDHETLLRSRHVAEKLDAPEIHHKKNALAGQIVVGSAPAVPCDTCTPTSSEGGRKMKPDYPCNATGDTETAVRDNMEEEESFSPNEILTKKQALTSFTEVSLQHPSESTLKAGYIQFDSDCSYKRQKTFNGRHSTSSSRDEQWSSESLSKIHALEARWGWRTTLDGAECTYKVPADLGSTGEPISDHIVHVPCDTCIPTSSEGGRKMKPDYPCNATGDTETAVRDNMEEEESFSPNEILAKKQALTSFTEVSLQHPSKSTLKAGYIQFDSDCSYKKQKTFNGRHSTISSRDEQWSSKSLSKIHALEAHWGWRTTVDGAECTYKVPADLGSTGEPISDHIVHVLSSDDEDSPEPSTSLNKSPLKAEEGSSPLLSLSLSTAAKAHNLTGSDTGDDRSLAVSLGLPLPGVIKGNQGLEMKQFLPEKPGINTSFLL